MNLTNHLLIHFELLFSWMLPQNLAGFRRFGQWDARQRDGVLVEHGGKRPSQASHVATVTHVAGE